MILCNYTVIHLHAIVLMILFYYAVIQLRINKIGFLHKEMFIIINSLHAPLQRVDLRRRVATAGLLVYQTRTDCKLSS